MVSDVLRLCALACVAVAACLPDNPEGELTTESESSEGSDSETGDGSVGLLGCPAGETCTLVLVSETLDDRVEIFEPGGDPAYRGSIDVNLKMGTGGPPGLDEPFGLTIVDDALHVIVGHYPQTESGSMLSFSRQWLSMFPAGTEVRVDQYYSPGSFIPEVTHTPFGELEPIFLLEDPVGSGENTRLLVSVFNNDLVTTTDAEWDRVGRLAVVDAADPSNFGIRDLSLANGDCLGAAQLVLLEGTQAAVACDGNDAIAFLNLGEIDSGEPQAAADAITGVVCDMPASDGGRRVRYMAHDGVGGVLVQYGPGFEPDSGDIYRAGPPAEVPDEIEVCSGLATATIGSTGTAQLGEVLQFNASHWLVASGGNYAEDVVQRGIYVLRGDGQKLEVCGSIGGFDWSPAGGEGSQQLTPFALALDGDHLAVGAGPFNTDSQIDGMLGKVLWATLSGTDDPCTMTADVVDLTDGGAGHAPVANPNDESTSRRAPSVVVIEEVQG